MKKVKRRIFARVIFVLFGVFFSVTLSSIFFFFKTTNNVRLDIAKLERQSEVNNLSLYDCNMEEINTDDFFSRKHVSIEELPSYVLNAFIVTEDKRFYKHNGVDYYRLFGAIVNNIKSKKFSQGASTISQQLIKNTHLSREKTIKRKLKEIRLSWMLERRYTKNEILEKYLNSIYFGNGCYGIEKASNYYFGKKAKELSVGETAMLVSTINAPSIYDPINKNDNAEKRKRLVLKLMKNNNVISGEEYWKNAKNNEKIVKNHQKTTKIHSKYILEEASKILGVTLNQLKNMNLKIKTTIDLNVQNEVLKSVNDNNLVPKNSLGFQPKIGVVIIDNKSKGVIAVYSTNGFNVLKDKRQPGSTMKPILVYAPALDAGLIYSESIIKDEEINIDGYSPSNANKIFLGDVSVRESIEKSLNVPAVKTLSKVGVKRAKKFAEKNGIVFNEKDNNLALALGGMTDGVTAKTLCDAYSSLATSGKYKSSTLIKEIIDKNGKVLFTDNSNLEVAMTEGTAGVVTDMLKGVVTNGTARRLNSLGFDVASKTGTVGLVSSIKNTDAINVSYTPHYTIVSWLCVVNENEYMESNVNGSTYPTLLTKSILSSLYDKKEPEKFNYGDDVVYKHIDVESLKKGVVELADEFDDPSNKKIAIFNKKYIPEYAIKKEVDVCDLEVVMEKNKKPTFSFNCEKDQEYLLIRSPLFEEKEEIINKVSNVEKTQIYTDINAKTSKIYEYYLKISKNGSRNYKTSNKIKLMSY